MGSYADAVVRARRILVEGRLNDELEHFPYKHDEVSDLVERNPPMGPEGPDDGRVLAEDFISQGIADATRDYIEAQAAYLRDPHEGNRQAYDEARDRLQEQRAAHRAKRGPANVVGLRARRAGE